MVPASTALLALTVAQLACLLAPNALLAPTPRALAVLLLMSARTAQLGFTTAHLALHLAFHVTWAPSKLSPAHPNVQTAWRDPTVVALV